MAKRFRIVLLALCLALLSCVGVGAVFAKYRKEIPVGSFNLSIKASRQSFAVYSAYDQSLNFYYGIAPTAGEDYNGKIATEVYKANSFLNSSTPPWAEKKEDIQSVTVVHEGIQPTLTKNWFAGFTRCTSFELSNLDTSKVTEMGYMFQGCTAVEHLNLSSFDTLGLVDHGMEEECMYGMFLGCVNLKTLDISNFSTKKVNGIDKMFNGCENLTTIYAGADLFKEGFFDTSVEVFTGCTSLVGGSGSTSEMAGIGMGSIAARIDGSNGNKGLLTGIVHPKIDTTTLTGVKWNFSTESDNKTNFAPNTESYIQLSGTTVPSEVMITSSDETVEPQVLTVDSDGVLTIPAEFMIKYQSFTIKNNPITIIVTNKEELDDAIANGQDYVVEADTIEESSIKATGVTVTVKNATLENVIGGTSMVSTEGGTIIVEYADDTTNPGRAGVFNALGGEIIIKDGVYAAAALAMGNSDGKITIEGGKFTISNLNGWMGMLQRVGTLTIKGGYFNIDPSSYVSEADGYTVIAITDGEFYAAGYRYQVVPI